MDLVEFYRTLYEEENARGRDIYERLNIPILVLSALVTLLYFFVSDFDYTQDLFWSVAFIGVVSLGGLSSLWALVNMALVFSPTTKNAGEYSRFPYADDLEKWRSGLVPNSSTVEEQFHHYLVQKYSTYAAVNMRINDRRFTRLYHAKIALIVGLGILLSRQHSISMRRS